MVWNSENLQGRSAPKVHHFLSSLCKQELKKIQGERWWQSGKKDHGEAYDLWLSNWVRGPLCKRLSSRELTSSTRLREQKVLGRSEEEEEGTQRTVISPIYFTCSWEKSLLPQPWLMKLISIELSNSISMMSCTVVPSFGQTEMVYTASGKILSGKAQMRSSKIRSIRQEKLVEYFARTVWVAYRMANTDAMNGIDGWDKHGGESLGGFQDLLKPVDRIDPVACTKWLVEQLVGKVG